MRFRFLDRQHELELLNDLWNSKNAEFLILYGRRRVDPSKSVSQNIKSQLLTPNNLLRAEPRLLLQDFVSEPHNYIAILNAIANGAHTVKEIVSGAGLPTGQVAKKFECLN